MNTKTTIETISEFRARHARHNAFLDTTRSRSGWSSYKPEEVPEDARFSNDDTSALEVYGWLTTPPDRYTLYINAEARTATTWTGDVLGRVSFGKSFRDNFGGVRVPVSVHGINGRLYHGTYYRSAGDYARIKLAKHQHHNLGANP